MEPVVTDRLLILNVCCQPRRAALRGQDPGQQSQGPERQEGRLRLPRALQGLEEHVGLLLLFRVCFCAFYFFLEGSFLRGGVHQNDLSGKLRSIIRPNTVTLLH